MKVSAANQSLILASDGPSGGKPPASASQSSRSASNGGASTTALQRLTVVAELPDSTVVTVHADYGGGGHAGTYSNPSTPSDRVVSSQTPSASQDDSDSDVDALLGSISSSGASALTETAASADAVATTGTNTTASTSASASSLVQLSSPAYNSLLRDSDNSRDTAGNPHSSNENVALYARTQRTTAAARSSSLVDVHA
jgi:hypothetical protein